MKNIVSLGAVLALAGAAVAGPFSIGTVDASDGLVAGGLPGTGLDFNGGVVYQDGFGTPGNTGEPNAAFLPLAPSLANDTYLTVDSGPVSLTYNGSDVAAAGEAPGSPGFVGGGYRGAWFVSGPFVNAFATTKDFGNGPEATWEIFVGRITLNGGSLSGHLAVAFAEPGDANFSTIEGDLNFGAYDAGWDFITTDNTGRPLAKAGQGRGYAWVVKTTDTPQGLVHDIYLQNVPVPTPGAMGLLGVAGLAAIRRRR